MTERTACRLEVKDSDIGRAVVYTGNRYPGGKQEEGVITSFNDYCVFVRYGADKGSKGTSREDLEWAMTRELGYATRRGADETQLLTEVEGLQERRSEQDAEIELIRRYATQLAVGLWEQHWKTEAPDWKPLPDLLGVLTQIDNMTTGLARALEPKP